MKYFLFFTIILICKRTCSQNIFSIDGKKFTFSRMEAVSVDTPASCNRVLKYYTAVSLDFGEKLITVSNGKYRIVGKYTMVIEGNSCYYKIRFKTNHFNFYENGSKDRNQFATVLFDLKTSHILFDGKNIIVKLNSKYGDGCLFHFASADL